MESSMRPMKVKTPPRKVFQYKKADYDQMREDLRDYQTDFTEQTKDSSANDTLTKFEEKLKELTNKHIPSKMLSGNKIKKPWMDRTVKAQQRKVKKLFAKQKQTGKARNMRQYLKTKSQAKRKNVKPTGNMLRTSLNWGIVTKNNSQVNRKDSSVSLNP